MQWVRKWEQKIVLQRTAVSAFLPRASLRKRKTTMTKVPFSFYTLILWNMWLLALSDRVSIWLHFFSGFVLFIIIFFLVRSQWCFLRLKSSYCWGPQELPFQVHRFTIPWSLSSPKIVFAIFLPHALGLFVRILIEKWEWEWNQNWNLLSCFNFDLHKCCFPLL